MFCFAWKTVLSSRNLCKKVRVITPDNASDVCSWVSKLLSRLLVKGNSASIIKYFHVRCIFHVVNLGVKECLGLIRDEIATIRSLINSISASVKRCDLFYAVKGELGENPKLPVPGVETRWYSTFRMMKDSFAVRRVFTVVWNRIPELEVFVIRGFKMHGLNVFFRLLDIFNPD